MILSARQSETLRKICDLEMSGQRRFIYAHEAEELCDLQLVEKHWREVPQTPRISQKPEIQGKMAAVENCPKCSATVSLYFLN